MVDEIKKEHYDKVDLKKVPVMTELYLAGSYKKYNKDFDKIPNSIPLNVGEPFVPLDD